SVGDKQASFELNDDTINFVVPEDAEVGNNKIVLSMEDNSKVQLSFRVLPWLLPRIQEFDAFVPVGGELVITGRKFNPENDPRVTIGGIEAEIVSNTNTELVVIVPDGIPDDEAHEIEITTSYGSTTTKTAFVARENLLMNSQLNEGSGNDFTHWEKLIGGDGMTGKTGAAAYGTGRSMRVVGAGGNPWDTQLASIGVPLTFGAEYTVVIWAKAESVDPSPTISFSVSQWDGNGADYSYSDIIEIGNQWAP